MQKGNTISVLKIPKYGQSIFLSCKNSNLVNMVVIYRLVEKNHHCSFKNCEITFLNKLVNLYLIDVCY